MLSEEKIAQPQNTEELRGRQNEILGMVIERLHPRPGSIWSGKQITMERVGKVLGLMVAVAELQALIEVRERGMKDREAILSELDKPPFKYILVPEGWESPCVSYIRKRLYSGALTPDTAWPLWGTDWELPYPTQYIDDPSHLRSENSPSIERRLEKLEKAQGSCVISELIKNAMIAPAVIPEEALLKVNGENISFTLTPGGYLIARNAVI